MADRAQFDHYEVLTRDDGSLHELGRGAMGITYKAFDSNLRVPVALKVIIAGHLDNDSARTRFVSEARAAALLRHRHVASVFHLGIEDNTYFYAMEFIDGETAEELVKREGPLSVTLALTLAVQVTRALAAAQRQDLVHRDIKPANLMLVTEDDEVTVKVIDFGLAKSIRRGGGDEAATTIAGFVGTPHFASPEQLEEKPIDLRSDLYSLGATLWFLLTGRPPFAGTLAQVISQQLSKPPDLDDLGHLPEPVRALLARLLEKDPAKRYQSAADLRVELERLLEVLPPEAPSDSRVDKAEAVHAIEDETRRHRNRPFSAGDLVAERYEILRDLGEGAQGDIFQARDRESGAEVRLIVVSPSLIEDAQAFTQLEHDVERLQTLDHRNLIGVKSLEVAGERTLLIMGWTRGFSLVELLRARRELEPEDALPIVKQLASVADFATEKSLERMEVALHRIWIDFPELRDEKTAEELKTKPVAGWPVFLAKVNPVGFARILSSSDTWAGGQTIVGGISGTVPGDAKTPETGHSYLRSLAGVTYELLGGSPTLGGGPGHATSRYVPLAMLSEQGNDVLKRALQPESGFENARLFHEELERAWHQSPRQSAGRSSISGLNALAQVHAAAEQTAWETRHEAVASRPPPVKKRPVLMMLAGAGIGLAMIVLGALLWPIFMGSIPGQKKPAVVAKSEPTPEQVSPPEEMPTPELVPTPEQVPTPEPAPTFKETPTPKETAKPKVTSKPKPKPTPKAIPLPTIAVIPPTPSPEPTAIQTPTPVPTPSREERLAQEIKAAEGYEREGNWQESIASLLAIMQGYPESDAGRIRLELLLQKLRTPEVNVSDGDFRVLRPSLENAAKMEVLPAMLLLGQFLRDSDPRAAFAWYSEAAEKGSPEAYTQVGLMYSNGAGVEKNLKKSVEWFQRSAELKDPPGLACLGECYLNGKGVERSPKTAARFLKQAVDLGDPRAMNLLGTLYHQGRGLEPNFAEAKRLFDEAVKRGHLDALGNLGVLYINGDGVPRDLLKAVELFSDGSRKGNAYCMYLYARCLESGTGVAANEKEARHWYFKSAVLGHPGAIAWCKARGVGIPDAA